MSQNLLVVDFLLWKFAFYGSSSLTQLCSSWQAITIGSISAKYLLKACGHPRRDLVWHGCQIAICSYYYLSLFDGIRRHLFVLQHLIRCILFNLSDILLTTLLACKYALKFQNVSMSV